MANYNMTSDCGGCNRRPQCPIAHTPNTASRPMKHHMPKPRPCTDRNDPLAGMAIAMAYVPWQFMHETYEPDKALQYGTIFPELNKPFYGKGGCMK